MDIKLDKKKVEQLKGMLKYHPEGERAGSIMSELMDIQEISNRVKYPINTFRQLQEQLGGSKEMAVGGNSIPLAEMKSRIPAYYFPITCEEDFMDKAAELMKANQPTAEAERPMECCGEEISVENAPQIPKGLREFRFKGNIPECGFMGYKLAEILPGSQSKEER